MKLSPFSIDQTAAADADLHVQLTRYKSKRYFSQLFKIRVNPMYSSSPYIFTILITHQILNIIQGGVVQHVPMPASQPSMSLPALSPGVRALLRRQWMTQITKEFVSALYSALGILRLFSDSIHLISPSQQALSSFLDESSLLCLIFFSFFLLQSILSDIKTNHQMQ